LGTSDSLLASRLEFPVERAGRQKLVDNQLAILIMHFYKKARFCYNFAFFSSSGHLRLLRSASTTIPLVALPELLIDIETELFTDAVDKLEEICMVFVPNAAVSCSMVRCVLPIENCLRSAAEVPQQHCGVGFFA
jgi:hypothetical protein